MALLASAWGDAGAVTTAVVAVVATIAAVWQLPAIKRQTRLSADASKSQSYGQVTQQMGALSAIFFETPDWLAYFYEGADPADDELEPNELRRLELVCEAIADFADGLVEQRRSVPEADMDWSTWDAYLRFLHQNSPFLQRYLRENTDFYPDYLLSAFGYLVVRDELTGEITSEWAVSEWHRPEGEDAEERDEADRAFERWVDATFPDPERVGHVGYPWLRTWVISRCDDEPGGARGPVLVASARPDEENVARATVRFAWHPEPPALDRARIRSIEEVLCAWVIEQLESSSRLRHADVHFLGGERPDDRGRVYLSSPTRTRRIPRPVTAALRRRGVLRKHPTDPSRERFLARTFDLYRPRGRR
jgi:hypothetical protein